MTATTPPSDYAELLHDLALIGMSFAATGLEKQAAAITKASDLLKRLAVVEGENARLRKALLQADLALKAIGHPEPNDPPDARICAVIAKGALVRIRAALSQKEG